MLECWWRGLWIPILVDGREDIECGEDIRDHQMQVSKCEMSPGANPRSSTFTTA